MARSSRSFFGGSKRGFGLSPVALRSASWASRSGCTAAWPKRSASTITCSDTSRAPPSTITMASREAAMMTSRSHSARCARVGFATNWPFSRPTRTPAKGPPKGMSEMWSAAEAPVSARMSVSFSWSKESTVAMICVSFA